MSERDSLSFNMRRLQRLIIVRIGRLYEPVFRMLDRIIKKG